MHAVLAEMMTSPGFGEVMFLVALILFALAFVGELAAVVARPPTSWAYARVLALAGLACAALGWMALVTGD